MNDRGRDIPVEQDEGKNKYIPQFISNAPWYQSSTLGTDGTGEKGEKGEKGDYLAHQRLNPKDKPKNFSVAQRGVGVVDSYREVVDENVLTKKRASKSISSGDSKKTKRLLFKNSKIIKCSNCGSTVHKRNECLEKPRKVAVQYRDDIDSLVSLYDQQDGKIKVRDEKTLANYDAKRDNYYGYDPKEWDKNLRRYKEAEKLKKQKETEEAQNHKFSTNDDDEDDDEALELAELGLAPNNKTLNTIKQDNVKAPGEKTIRLLEDRASYLESVTAEEKPENDEEDGDIVLKLTYNPKTRSILDPKMGEFNEENLFVRNLDGEAAEFEKLKQFAWDTQKSASTGEGSKEKDFANLLNHHPEASPTALMLEARKQKEEAEKRKAQNKKALLEKYG